MHFTGSFDAKSAPELLSTIMLSGNSAIAFITSEQGEARLGFLGGELVRVSMSGSSDLGEGSSQGPEDARESALAAILTLLAWSGGTFRLEPLADPLRDWGSDDGVLLSPGVPSDLLELELTRIADERARTSDRDGPTARRLTPAEVPRVEADAPACSEISAPSPESSPADSFVLISVGSDPEMLEALKRAALPFVSAAHILPVSEEALRRVGYYVMRGKRPAVVIDVSKKGLARGLSVRQFAERLKIMSARALLAVVCDADQKAPRAADMAIRKPFSDADIGERLNTLFTKAI